MLGYPVSTTRDYRLIHFFTRVLFCVISQDATRENAKSQRWVDISRKEIYNLHKGKYANCKAIGDDHSEKL